MIKTTRFYIFIISCLYQAHVTVVRYPFSQMTQRENSVASLHLMFIALNFLFICSLPAQDSIVIQGSIFLDHDGNASWDKADFGHPALRVMLVRDENNNLFPDTWESVIDTVVSGVNGQFEMVLSQPILGTSRGDTVQLTEDALWQHYSKGSALLLKVVPDDLNASHQQSTAYQHIHPDAAKDLKIGIKGPAVFCYAVGDGSNPDKLVMVNHLSGTMTSHPGDMRVRYVEAIAITPGSRSLYAVNKAKMGRIDLKKGRFMPFSDSLGIGRGASGRHVFQDIDGMSFDPYTGVLYGVERTQFERDLLVQLDTLSGKIKHGVFGEGMDYVTLAGEGVMAEIDDIAVSPVSGRMYGINNYDQIAPFDLLVSIDKQTGKTHILDTIKVGESYLHDIEGMGFTPDGKLIVTTGSNAGAYADMMFELSLYSAQARPIGKIALSTDYEACDCMLGAYNEVAGQVFEDLNANKSWEKAEIGLKNSQVLIYRDDNGDGKINGNDALIDSVRADSSGYFSWKTVFNRAYIFTMDDRDIPQGFRHTTRHYHARSFEQGFGGQKAAHLVFGFQHTQYLDQWQSGVTQYSMFASDSLGEALLSEQQSKLPVLETQQGGNSQPNLAQKLPSAAHSMLASDLLYLRALAQSSSEPKASSAAKHLEMAFPTVLGSAIVERLLNALPKEGEFEIELPNSPTETLLMQLYTQSRLIQYRYHFTAPKNPE